MNLTLIAVLFSAALFLSLLGAIEVGRRVGMGRLQRDTSGLAKGIGAAEGVVFGLLGLILAFAFSSAGARFEHRRHLIAEEANAIGTAYLRLDLLPAETQLLMREHFRRYLDLRLEVHRLSSDVDSAKARVAEATALETNIWKKAVAACGRPDVVGQATMLLLPALNAMFDIATTRTAETRNHPPRIVYYLLAGLSLIGSVLVGYGMAVNEGRTWLHTVAFAAIVSLSVYVIVDLEFPRLGLIQVGSADQLLVDMRSEMN